ncbi:MAG: hypothetical protein AB8B61_05520 [Cyclobacteriaceae bacterium]
MQSVADLKSSLLHYISETQDLQKLSTIQEYVKNLLHQEDKIIGYTAEGKPLNPKSFTKMINKAILEADNGELINQEEIEEES